MIDRRNEIMVRPDDRYTDGNEKQQKNKTHTNIHSQSHRKTYRIHNNKPSTHIIEISLFSQICHDLTNTN